MSGTDSKPIVVDDRSGYARTATEAEEREIAGVPLGKPNRKTVSTVWLLIVGANCFVYVAAASCLCVGLFWVKRDSLVEAVLLLNLVTTPAAFLAGLVARDPGQHS